MNKAYINFTEEATEAIRTFPDLQLRSREGSLPFLKGKITLRDEYGASYDAYHIKIDCSDDYPNNFPLVYETSGRLPKNIDWHVYEDGHFCICTPIEESIHCSKGITVATFIHDHILPYLHNQSFREKEGYFLHERSHGVKGILESIQDILKINDLKTAYSLLVHIYKNGTPSRTSPCFCGSEKKYRYCHREAYQSLKNIGQEKLLQIISLVKRSIGYN
ncbi:SEC-C domain-containing protein [Sphingobacterium sp. DN00404]|uniref:SEC-C domain-containing protein n=1 Tax=Sphingobacterium micropteri TaxID=2763501 RepID=A0ABR7YT57_9SPHI|nr:SEC-C metal-binding domain-containing protein [Sphingobacterium micropteri]MBD1434353.1 SEC-C domain-containing protein [Sphingobacterium micropteri]